MTQRAKYMPGPASGATVEKNGEKWTLVLTRQLRHAPEKVWDALTDPAQLTAWAPFDADRSLATVGSVKLTTIGAPEAHASCETVVERAEAPKHLEYSWGGQHLRWELEPLASGTKLTLWHNIDRRYIAWGAAGWHICFDVLDHLLAHEPIGRLTGPEAMKLEGWQRLAKEYREQFAEGSES